MKKGYDSAMCAFIARAGQTAPIKWAGAVEVPGVAQERAAHWCRERQLLQHKTTAARKFFGVEMKAFCAHKMR